MKIKDVIFENTESDLELFGKPGEVAQYSQIKIKKDTDPYLATIRKIRELAKTKYGVKIRVSSPRDKWKAQRATVWIGDYDSTNGSPKISPKAYKVKEDLEQMGFECRFTDAGWLSVRIPPPFSDLLAEDDSDDELFGPSTGPSHTKLRKILSGVATDFAYEYLDFAQNKEHSLEDRQHDLKMSEEFRELANRFNQDLKWGLQTWHQMTQLGWSAGAAGDFANSVQSNDDVNLPTLAELYFSLTESDESDDELFGEPPTVLDQVQKLLARKQPVVCRIFGAMGIIVRVTTDPNVHIVIRPLNQPHSRKRYALHLSDERLARIELKHNDKKDQWELIDKEELS